MVLINLFAGKEWRHTCRQWICGHREGESGTNGENSIYLSIYLYIYTLSDVSWKAGKLEMLLCSIGSPIWFSVMTWRDGMWGKEGS